MFSARTRVILSLISGLVIIAGILIAVILTTRPQGAFETRKKAAETFAVIPSPTQTTALPLSSAVINFKLSLEGRENHAISVDIYGLKKGEGNALPQFSLSNSIKLGTTTTDPNGYGKLYLDSFYIGRTFYLFAQTPSHLRKSALNYQPLTISAGNNPPDAFVDFGTLTAGDIYLDINGQRDNAIDSLDLAQFYTAWNLLGKKNLTDSEKKQIQAADLNGDGVINNRDLVILSNNIGKTGDSFPPLLPSSP